MAEIPATHPAWHPTPSQKEAIQKLHLSANVFSRVGDRKLAGFSPAYWEHEMDQFDMGEQDFAMIRTCAYVHGTESERAHALKPLWFYSDYQGRVRGPISEIELKQAFDKGVLLRTVFVWREGIAAWQQAARVPAFQTESYAGIMPPALP